MAADSAEAVVEAYTSDLVRLQDRRTLFLDLVVSRMALVLGRWCRCIAYSFLLMFLEEFTPPCNECIGSVERRK